MNIFIDKYTDTQSIVKCVISQLIPFPLRSPFPFLLFSVFQTDSSMLCVFIFYRHLFSVCSGKCFCHFVLHFYFNFLF